MKKILFVAILMVAIVDSAVAQLVVDWNGRVRIATSLNDNYSRLSVGNNSCFQPGGANIGLSSAPLMSDNKNNIAIEGLLTGNTNYSNENNYGVLGIARLNTNHGRNYGVSGMLDFSSANSNSGGAGVYATNYMYMYSYPDNIQGMYALYVHGFVNLSGATTAQEIYTPADDRLNENVDFIGQDSRETGQTLNNLLKMNVIECNYKNRNSERANNNIDEMTDEVREAYEMMRKDEEKTYSRRHFALSAQELQEIYPNLVMEGQDGYLAVNYTELVPLLIRSIQELKQELDEARGSDGMIKRIPQSSGMGNIETDNKNVLYQNRPNPFKEKTTIRFKLDDEAMDAAICIFDMSGKMLKKLPISNGMESVSVNGYELGEGMFLYSLLVNGQEVDTKRMILSK